MNLCILIGRLGRDAELKYVNSGTAVCSFSLATNERLHRGKAREDIVTWHRIVAWNDLAEKARTLKRGQLVMVEGALHTDEWQDRSGNKRETLQVVCRSFRPLAAEEV